MRNLFPSMVVQSPRQLAGALRSRAVRDPIVLKCKQFVDQEGLTCLLALLVRGYSPAVSLSGNPPGDLPTSAGPGRQLLLCSSVRRLLRNLAYHSPTRHWLLRALLSILHSAAAAAAAPVTASAPPSASDLSCPENGQAATKEMSLEATVIGGTEVQLNPLLTMSYPVALGCRVPFFIVMPSKRCEAADNAESPAQEKERASGDVYEDLEVRIHPRVAAFVCKTMLETLADLGQCFYEPMYPNPVSAANSSGEEQKENKMEVDISSPRPNQQNQSPDSADVVDCKLLAIIGHSKLFMTLIFDFVSAFSPRTEFWKILLRLDRPSPSALNLATASAPTVSPSKSLELGANQSGVAVSDCAFVSVASLLLHDGLYRRQELLETILKLLDEILNKFKVHTENKRLNSNLTSHVSIIDFYYTGCLTFLNRYLSTYI